MENFVEISSDSIFKAVYDSCFQANINLPKAVYDLLYKAGAEGFEPQSKISQILSNAAIANINQRPLCQDTGQVLVFVELGQNVRISDGNLNKTINGAVEACFKDNFFRKSIVKNAIFERTNTDNNLPAIIYTDIVDGDSIKLNILIKGGGAENMSAVKMFNPSASEIEIFDFVLDTVKSSGTNACPPLFLGIGAGGTIDLAAVLSKKAYFRGENNEFSEKLKNYINENSETKVLDIKMLTAPTHIASMPVCVTMNCHSTRHASILIGSDSKAVILTEFVKPFEIKADEKRQEIKTTDFEAMRNLNVGEEISLTGEIFTARDMAHKKIAEMISNSENLPFEIKDKIIFYAGPCPKKEDEIIGPIGPTTAKRMDKFTPMLYDLGLFATIGKGERSDAVKESIETNNAIYFSVQGGVAALLQKCIKKSEIVAFEEFGTEAVRRLEIEKFPVKVEFKGN